MNLFAKQKQRHTCREKKYTNTQRGHGGWDELGDWDGHIYTIDMMYKIDN